MSFFLNEVLIQKKMMEPKLDYFKYPFLIVCVAQWAIYITFVVTINLNRSVINLVRAGPIFSLIFSFSIFVYFTVVGVLMIKRLLRFKNKMMRKVLPLVIFQSFGILLFIAVDSMIVSIYYLEVFNPDLFLGCWIVYWIAANIIVLAQVLTFRRPKLSASSTKDKPFENLDKSAKNSNTGNQSGI
eukprot:TRINITY_DN965_c0_g3_i1.p1 TRINITY_DN965_c0_g3~~TRINITY_DN965_c0_g3_i1.p1  ORF type:complete len:185 (+),score=20.03 TRINITY_DN965_c0_g3_i1:1-555(+)